MKALATDSTASDAELLSAFRGGSQRSFDLLYDRYKNALFLHARAVTRDDAVAEDLVHDTFLKLSESGDGALPATGTLAPFLHRVLRNLAIDRLRSETAARRREEVAALRWVRAVQPQPDASWVEKLNRSLAALPPEQLEILILHVYGGLTFQEAADATGVPIKTALSRYRYALQKLAQKLGESP